MINKYEIWFESEIIGTTGSFVKALDLGYEILASIARYPDPNDPDEYMYLQIRSYHWFDRLFNPKDYDIVEFSKIHNRFIVKK